MTHREYIEIRRATTIKALSKFAKGQKNALTLGHNDLVDLKMHYRSHREPAHT